MQNFAPAGFSAPQVGHAAAQRVAAGHAKAGSLRILSAAARALHPHVPEVTYLRVASQGDERSHWARLTVCGGRLLDSAQQEIEVGSLLSTFGFGSEPGPQSIFLSFSPSLAKSLSLPLPPFERRPCRCHRSAGRCRRIRGCAVVAVAAVQAVVSVAAVELVLILVAVIWRRMWSGQRESRPRRRSVVVALSHRNAQEIDPDEGQSVRSGYVMGPTQSVDVPASTVNGSCPGRTIGRVSPSSSLVTRLRRIRAVRKRDRGLS